MKKTTGFLLLAAFLAAAGAACIVIPYDESDRPAGPNEGAYDNDQGRYSDLDSAYFYDELQPYGAWVSCRPYGYVWIPGDVGYSWRPYTRGHWAWTDYGWTWVSIERWGWIAFHYGRWGWDRALGWFWVPDIVWGPAWVAWRWGDAHIGWAPLPPGSDFVPGRGFGRRQWDIPGDRWNFVRGRDFMDRTIDRRVLPPERNRTIIDMTRFEVNIDERDRRVFDEGVDVDLVRRQTNRAIDRYTLKDATRPGPAREEGRDLVVSKPAVRRNDSAKPKRTIDQATAEKELGPEASSRIYRRTPRREEEALREEHLNEQRLLKDSQEAELRAVETKAREEGARIQSPEEKRKVDDQASSRVSELKRRHEQEKADLEKRQKTEEKKVQRTPVRRKTAAEPEKR
ncbi:MAG: DUF6600 domain-containing protein [Acidobacteriota bacterium]